MDSIVAELLDKIPSVFHGAREYKEDPGALELAQATFNEAGLYDAIASLAVSIHNTLGRPLKVLDLCAATGLSTVRVAKSVPIAAATLVDLDRLALGRARVHLDGLCSTTLVEADAAGYSDEGGLRSHSNELRVSPYCGPEEDSVSLQRWSSS